MTARLVVFSLSLLALAACGVKTDLDPPPAATTTHPEVTPDQNEAAKRAPDPSKPPHPLAQ
jgi:predicted small lipoprotein YifL